MACVYVSVLEAEMFVCREAYYEEHPVEMWRPAFDEDAEELLPVIERPPVSFEEEEEARQWMAEHVAYVGELMERQKMMAMEDEASTEEKREHPFPDPPSPILLPRQTMYGGENGRARLADWKHR
jgi:hypothetical protein